MAENTPNYNLEKQAGNDNVDINGINSNFDIIDAEIKNAHDKANQAFQSASEGKQKIATAITGKGVPTNSSDTFQTIANNIEAIETDPSIGTTDATAADILSGKKAVSQGNLLIGTMPVAPTFPNENEAEDTHFYGTDFTSSVKGNNLFMKVPKGYYNGGWLGARVNNLIPSNVKAGIVLVPRLGGTKSLTGTFTSDGTATAAHMLSGAVAYVNGNKITGTIPSKAAQTYTPGTTNQTIAAGQYLNGAQIIEGSANLLPENIKSGVNIFGKVGALKPASALAINATNFLSEGQGSGPVLPVFRVRGTVTSTLGSVTLEDLIMKAVFSNDAYIEPLDNDVFFRNSDSQENSNASFNKWYKAERGVQTRLKQAWTNAVILNMAGGRVRFVYYNSEITIWSIIEKP